MKLLHHEGLVVPARNFFKTNLYNGTHFLEQGLEGAVHINHNHHAEAEE
jgi:hypothetical protein